jgi:LPS-assembly protein
MMPKCYILFIAVGLLIFSASLSRGQVREGQILTPRGPMEIEADRVIHDRERDLYEARGNVEIRIGEVRLRADEVDFSPDTQIAEARGNVELTDGEDVLRSEKMRANLETQQGVVEDARLMTREDFYITGKRIEKLGPKTYRIHEATFTTCGGDVPDWVFKAKSVDVTMEGYAVARQSSFNIREIPVAYLPIGIFPVKTKRQTGFLIPGVGYSGKFGPEVNLPFFWAISQDKDATFYLNWLGDRGVKEGGEFRYALSRDTEGQANFYFIDDQVEDENRWAFLFRHDQRTLPLGFYARGNVNLVSDNDYVFDFEEDFPGRTLIDVRSDRHLESTFFGGRVWPQYNLIGEFSYFDDLTVRDNDGTLQRLPEITMTAFDQPIWKSPLYAGGEFSYTNFWRQEGVRGSRLDFFPQISLPFRPLKWLKFLPLAGLRETLYWPENDPERKNDFETRTLPTLEATLSTTVSRLFDVPPLAWERLRHRIEPVIRYTYIPRVDQDDLPFFDETDQIPYTSQITYGLNNFIDGRMTNSAGSEIRRILQMELSQSYSLGDPLFPGEEAPERRFSNIRGDLWFFPSTNLNLRSNAEYSLIRDRIVLFSTLANLVDSRGDSVTLEYRFLEDELETINSYLQVKLWDRADLFASYRYDVLNDLRIETRAGVTYYAQCWNVTFSVEDRNHSFDRTRDDEVKFKLSLSLVGLGSVGSGR